MVLLQHSVVVLHQALQVVHKASVCELARLLLRILQLRWRVVRSHEETLHETGLRIIADECFMLARATTLIFQLTWVLQRLLLFGLVDQGILACRRVVELKVHI